LKSLLNVKDPVEIPLPGVAPSPAAPCEPGATALSGDVSLAKKVLVCPPAECVSSGLNCMGHELLTKGLRGCAVNTTSMEVGATAQVTFLVFDDSVPPTNATVTRTLTVLSPCAPGEQLCDGDVCSAVSCALRQALLVRGRPLPPRVLFAGGPTQLRSVEASVRPNVPLTRVCVGGARDSMCRRQRMQTSRRRW
jgi:hypothetical protein